MITMLISILMTLFIGGVITGNILGDMKQKAGELVFFDWKGIQVFRKKVIPTNPNSVAQQAQRGFFASVLALGKVINTQWIKVFWKVQAIKMSEFNAWMKANLIAMNGTFTIAKAVMALGSIPNTAVTIATYNPSTGEVGITYPSSVLNGQSADDLAQVAIYNNDSGQWYINTDDGAKRSDGNVLTTIPAGLTYSDLHAFLSFTDKLTTVQGFKTSDSVYTALVEQE